MLSDIDRETYSWQIVFLGLLVPIQDLKTAALVSTLYVVNLAAIKIRTKSS